MQEGESSYPYTHKNGNCAYNKSKGLVGVKSSVIVARGKVGQLKAAIAKGPVSVTVDASSSVFSNYKSGILNSAACGTSLDHAITAVGYGTAGGQDFYIIRNSWSARWGDHGYIKIAAVEGDGICGIQKVSVLPIANN